VELEDASTLGRSDRIIEIDRVDDPNGLDTEQQAAREGPKGVAKEPNSRCRASSVARLLLFGTAR
jgi:hypothetical protein